MKIYCDTSALAKLYLREPYSEFVVSLFADTESQCFVSLYLAKIEMHHTFFRVLSKREAEHRIGTFLSDLDYAIASVNMTERVCDLACQITKSTNCKSLDALHIASAMANGADISFLTFDKRQGNIAASYGLDLIKPQA